MKQERRGLYYYICVGEHGEVLRISRSSQPKPKSMQRPGTIDLMCQHCIDQLGRDPYKCRWNGEHLDPLVSVSLAASAALICADGEDIAAVCVKGLPDEIDDVELLVNGEKITLPRGEEIELKTTTPGEWTVRLADRRLAAEVMDLTVKAVTREDYNEFMKIVEADDAH